MSPMNAIKTFRDLLSFLTIIPLGKTEDFVLTSAEYIFLFPVVGAFIGLLGGAYFFGCGLLVSYLLALVNLVVRIPVGFLLRLVPAVMTLAFLNVPFAFGVIVASEVAAKLGMVTISWLGKPTHEGLGSVFLVKAKRKRNVVAYFLAILVVYPLLGLVGVWIVLIGVLLGIFMERVGKSVFGGVVGDV